jgi:hypothetical protein
MPHCLSIVASTVFFPPESTALHSEPPPPEGATTAYDEHAEAHDDPCKNDIAHRYILRLELCFYASRNIYPLKIFFKPFYTILL